MRSRRHAEKGIVATIATHTLNGYMDSTTLGIKLDVKTRDRLKTLGRKKDRATHWLIKKAIEEYLAKEELVERVRREDEIRWERYQASGEAIPNDRVVAWLDELTAGKRTSWRR